MVETILSVLVDIKAHYTLRILQIIAEMAVGVIYTCAADDCLQDILVLPSHGYSKCCLSCFKFDSVWEIKLCRNCEITQMICEVCQERFCYNHFMLTEDLSADYDGHLVTTCRGCFKGVVLECQSCTKLSSRQSVIRRETFCTMRKCEEEMCNVFFCIHCDSAAQVHCSLELCGRSLDKYVCSKHSENTKYYCCKYYCCFNDDGKRLKIT